MAAGIATIGLTLNHSKLQVWDPGDQGLPAELYVAYPAISVSTAGFVMCGLPIDSPDRAAEDQAGPWGTTDCVRNFFQQTRHTFAARLRTLATFVNQMGPDTPALHVALAFVRVQLQSRHVHLLRFCPWQVTHEWAAELDRNLVEWLSRALDLPLDTPAARSVLRVPVALGGLGFLHPQHEAALHNLQALMPLAGEWSGDEEGDLLHQSIARTFDSLNRHARTDLRLLVAQAEPRNQARHVRSHFYERLALNMRDICPWLQAPALPKTPDGDFQWRWQIRCQMSWYVASPHYLLPSPLRLALASHMGLPIFSPGQRCHYTPITTGCRCHHQLGTHSDHVFACAQGPSMRRHNRMRDEWIALCRAT